MRGTFKKPHKVLSLSGVDWKLLLVGIWNSLALVAWETGAALRRKRGDASVHMYSFDEAAVVYQDIQGRLSNDWFVLTALLSLVHQPQISASSSTFFFFFYFFLSFFLKNKQQNHWHHFHVPSKWDEDHLPSVLHSSTPTLHFLCPSSSIPSE